MEPLNNLPSEFSRRTALKTATGLGLSLLLPGMDLPAAQRRGNERQKSLIVLWMAGGSSQLETWDPHPGSKVGGPTRAIKTKLPGLQIAHLYPQTAEQIHELSVVRSIVSKEGDHERGTYLLKTGFRPDPTLVHPSLGAILTHEKPDASIEIPQFVSLGGGQWPARGGYLGDQLDAFRIFDPGRNVRNMRPGVGQNDERQKRRLAGLDVVSKAFQRGRKVQANNTLHQLTVERALRMMNSDQLQAFDIENEPRMVRNRYGEGRFGRGCLVARRLIEEGVRAVEVTLTGWDTHANNFEGHQVQAEQLDPALSSLIKDLTERDLLDSTVLLCIGEFGRTPNINALDGRDHWPSGFSCIVGGAGLKSGLVIGETDHTGRKKRPKNPIEVADLYATVFKALGVEYDKEEITPIGRPMAFSSGTPIDTLL